jgi:hypothetical protein
LEFAGGELFNHIVEKGRVTNYLLRWLKEKPGDCFSKLFLQWSIVTSRK